MSRRDEAALRPMSNCLASSARQELDRSKKKKTVRRFKLRSQEQPDPDQLYSCVLSQVEVRWSVVTDHPESRVGRVMTGESAVTERLTWFLMCVGGCLMSRLAAWLR